MSGLCKTCKHWDTESLLFGGVWGFCQKAASDSLQRKDAASQSVAVSVRGREDCELMTSITFGCNQYEART